MTEHQRQRIVEILLRLSSLLMTGNPDSKWGHKLEVLAGKDTLCSEDLRLQVKGLFGGMGSLNDIVLFHSDGTVDRNGSTEFDMLRSQLYELVRSSA